MRGSRRGWCCWRLRARSIAQEVGIQPRIVSKWRHRFADHGLAGLNDRPRATKPDGNVQTGADLDAGGLIVQEKQVTGAFQKCTVKSLHDDGSNVKVIASCSDGVTVLDIAFDVKISGENNITLSSKEPVPVEML